MMWLLLTELFLWWWWWWWWCWWRGCYWRSYSCDDDVAVTDGVIPVMM